MVMVGQSRRLAQPLRLGRRERSILLLLGALTSVAVVALAVAAIAGGGTHTPRGCVTATTASYVGGGTVRACGADARLLCQSAVGGAAGSPRAVIAAACRRAGLSVAR